MDGTLLPTRLGSPPRSSRQVTASQTVSKARGSARDEVALPSQMRTIHQRFIPQKAKVTTVHVWRFSPPQVGQVSAPLTLPVSRQVSQSYMTCVGMLDVKDGFG